MDEMAAIILEGKQTIVLVDGEERLKDFKIIVALYAAVKCGKKVNMNL